MSRILVRIDTGRAVFALEADRATGKIVNAAPYGKRFIGRSGLDVIQGFVWAGAEVLVNDGSGWRRPKMKAE